jgi:hypothetical protein
VKYVHRPDGGEAILDDMSPHGRAFAMLIEHANAQRAGGYLDAAGAVIHCACAECQCHRAAIRCFRGPNGELIVRPA